MKKKVLVSAGALALAAGVGIGGTLAWLTATSEEKVNTFVYAFGGETDPITLTLTETFEQNASVTPGAQIEKVPVLTVGADSVDCYVYAEIDNQFGDIATLDIGTNNWLKVTGTENIYRYKDIVDTEKGTALPQLFNTVTFSTDLDADDLKGMVNPDAEVEGQLTQTITINGYAIQSDGEGMTQDLADGQAKTHFGVGA